MQNNRLDILSKDRRALHQIPGIGFENEQTLEYIEKRLRSMKCRILNPIPGALCAFFDAHREQSLAFRADIDALPIEEKNEESFASKNAGKMHACGHDGHMSMLLSLADIVNEKLESLLHNVLLIFQPAEETTGGAKLICDSGILEEYNARCIFGFHLWPGLPAGEIRSKPGPVMAKTSEVHISITGKSAHVARSEEGRDALMAAVEFLHKAYEMAEWQEPLSQKRLLKFGCMQSGTVQNAISAKALIGGTLRTYDKELFETMSARLLDIAETVQAQTGCLIETDISEGYPPVINDPALYRKIEKQLGVNAPLPLESPSLTGEDFSFYQERLPGVFFFLGTGRNEPLHSDKFGFDETALVKGLSLYELLLCLNLS